MNVMHVVPGILEEASGPSSSVPNLCQELAENRLGVELHVNIGEKPLGANYKFFVHGRWKWPPRLDISPRMYSAIKRNIKNVDIVHSHGLWNMSNIYPGWAVKKKSSCLLVISPRGTLSEDALQSSRWKKRIIWHLWQRRVLMDAHCIHVTSEAEFRQVRKIGVKAPVSIIPNGIKLPNLIGNSTVPEREVRKLLFLGRITPIKGVDILLNAWSIIQERFPTWELEFIGPDDRGYLKEMKNLARELNVKRTHFIGPLYGKKKSDAFSGADLFVLPTHSENFGMAVAEALSHEVPVIVSKGAPWDEIVKEDCGWWIDVGVEPLIECLNVALAESPESLMKKGKRGREWMKRDFSWDEIGRKMIASYEWMLKGGATPEWIRTQ